MGQRGKNFGVILTKPLIRIINSMRRMVNEVVNQHLVMNSRGVNHNMNSFVSHKYLCYNLCPMRTSLKWEILKILKLKLKKLMNLGSYFMKDAFNLQHQYLKIPINIL